MTITEATIYEELDRRLRDLEDLRREINVLKSYRPLTVTDVRIGLEVFDKEFIIHRITQIKETKDGHILIRLDWDEEDWAESYLQNYLVRIK